MSIILKTPITGPAAIITTARPRSTARPTPGATSADTTVASKGPAAITPSDSAVSRCQ